MPSRCAVAALCCQSCFVARCGDGGWNVVVCFWSAVGLPSRVRSTNRQRTRYDSKASKTARACARSDAWSSHEPSNRAVISGLDPPLRQISQLASSRLYGRRRGGRLPHLPCVGAEGCAIDSNPSNERAHVAPIRRCSSDRLATSEPPFGPARRLACRSSSLARRFATSSLNWRATSISSHYCSTALVSDLPNVSICG